MQVNKNSNNIKKISVIALLAALAYLCMFVFRFKVAFLTFDIKDAVLAISALMYGPLAGLVSSAVVALMELITVSDTGIYGMIMNFLSSATFTVVCGTVYKYRRNMSGAIFGVVASALSVTAVMLLANLFITPFYMGVERAEVVKMLGSLLLPFNLTKSVFNGAVVLLIYKPIISVIKKMGFITDSGRGNYKFGFKSALIMIFSLVIIVLVILFFVLKLNGSVEIFG